MARCQRTFERADTPSQRAGTHTCEKDAGHAPPHVCPTCGAQWVSEPGQRPNRVDYRDEWQP